MSTIDAPLGPLAARCAMHDSQAATGTCARCGTFFCAVCVRPVSGKDWCATCAARPEVTYLERFRLKLWGKRDGSAWVAGAGSVVGAGLVARELLDRPSWPAVGALAACALAAACFFLGLKRAREALILVPVVSGAACWALGVQGPGALLIIGGLLAVSVYFDTRSRLFFRVPVSAERLQRLWHLRDNNPRARDAMNLGVASLLFPLFAPLAIILGAVALRRVDPDAMPPIGRKGQALTGVVLGVATLVLWGTVLMRSQGFGG